LLEQSLANFGSPLHPEERIFSSGSRFSSFPRPKAQNKTSGAMLVKVVDAIVLFMDDGGRPWRLDLADLPPQQVVYADAPP
jgi:hypothetical protein